jgi:RNA polymerase sigma-70 factor (ECF subfamily)
MHTDLTQPSLLSRVRDPANHEAWRQFEAKYRGLIVRFCRARGLQQTDAEDVLQMVMTKLVQTLPRFTYQADRGRFRDYLYRIVRGAISDWVARPKSDGRPVFTLLSADTPPAQDAALESLWTQEWVNHHYRLALESVRQTFEARSIDIFERSLRGESVESLAAAFDMSTQAVHKVRQRLRARMEEAIAQQVHEEDVIDDSASA